VRGAVRLLLQRSRSSSSACSLRIRICVERISSAACADDDSVGHLVLHMRRAAAAVAAAAYTHTRLGCHPLPPKSDNRILFRIPVKGHAAVVPPAPQTFQSPEAESQPPSVR
jgi:hypothetical protein